MQDRCPPLHPTLLLSRLATSHNSLLAHNSGLRCLSTLPAPTLASLLRTSNLRNLPAPNLGLPAAFSSPRRSPATLPRFHCSSCPLLPPSDTSARMKCGPKPLVNADVTRQLSSGRCHRLLLVFPFRQNTSRVARCRSKAQLPSSGSSWFFPTSILLANIHTTRGSW